MLDKKELELAFDARGRGGCSYNDQVGMLFRIDMQRTLILVDKLSLMVSLFARSLFYDHSVLCQYYQLGIFKQSKEIYMTSFLAWSLWELAFVWNNG